ncbi:MAG: helix-turn-helix domain-containing protein [Polyangiaceae bacterium]
MCSLHEDGALLVKSTRDRFAHGALSCAYFLALDDYVREQGKDLRDFVDGGLLPPSTRCAWSDLWPVEDARRVIEQLQSSFGAADFGVRLGAALRCSHFGTLGVRARASKTIGEVLLVLFQNFAHLNTQSVMNVRVDGVELELSWSSAWDGCGHVLDVFSVAGLVSILRELAGGLVPLNSVGFCGHGFATAPHIEKFFGCRIVYGRPSLVLRVPIETLSLLTESGREHPGGAVYVVPPSQTSSGTVRSHEPTHRFRVEQAIRRVLDRGAAPSLARVARELGLHPRSLTRSLSAEKLDFSGLRDRVRCETACRLLTEESISLVEIAFALGFSTQASFTRAFGAWKGTSPAAFRRMRTSR